MHMKGSKAIMDNDDTVFSADSTTQFGPNSLMIHKTTNLHILFLNLKRLNLKP